MELGFIIINTELGNLNSKCGFEYSIKEDDNYINLELKLLKNSYSVNFFKRLMEMYIIILEQKIYGRMGYSSLRENFYILSDTECIIFKGCLIDSYSFEKDTFKISVNEIIKRKIEENDYIIFGINK